MTKLDRRRALNKELREQTSRRRTLQQQRNAHNSAFKARSKNTPRRASF